MNAVTHIDGCTGHPPTWGCDACRAMQVAPSTAPNLSPGARRTQRNKAMIAAGVHPATRQPIDVALGTCGTCAHAIRVTHNSRSYWKCDLHRLGTSASEASDIRSSWPACDRHESRSTAAEAL